MPNTRSKAINNFYPDPEPSKTSKNWNMADDELEFLLSDPSGIANCDITECCDILDLFPKINDKRAINKYIDIIVNVSKNIRKFAAKFEKLENMHDILKEIKEGITINNNNRQQNIPSFAQIVQKIPNHQSQAFNKQEERTIIIKPNNNVAPQLIENKVKTILKNSNKKVKINKIFSKQTCVIIKTANNEQISEELIDQINSHKDTKNVCSAYSPKLRDPTIVLKNVSTEIDLLNLTQQIVDCNEELTDLKNEIKFLFKMKHGDHTAKHMNIVLRVSPKVHHIITNTLNNKMYLDYQCCQVQTKLFVRQCQKCFKFNHKTQECRNHQFCKTCGQEKQNNHICPNTLSCSNCKTSIKFKNNTAHSPNNEHCPIYKAQLEKLYEQTNFQP
ncbi:hypothetical protein BLA29_001551 [Euroglyphus maynei]|uniref:Uncharacterized protein n=1 Tax=Euroglyphus maynei TaxID=6958 RepID=A0A1Y3BQV1_EURMA|nr:hypothetical protein BLA29_001551 [Euroglyphus maynei]